MPQDDHQTLAPSFVIYADGVRLSAEHEADVMKITIFDRLDAPSKFMIQMSDPTRRWTDGKDISICTEIKILLGYKDNLVEMMDGEITGINADYARNAEDCTTFIGHDRLIRLNRAIRTRSFNDMSASDIVRQLASDAGLKSDVEDAGPIIPFYLHRASTDFNLLIHFGEKYNCRFWVRDRTLHFKRVVPKRAEDVILEWGKSLMEFIPAMNTQKIFTDVEVRGWDKSFGKAVIGTASADDITQKVGEGLCGTAEVKQNFSMSYKHVLVSSEYEDEMGAEQAALDILTNNSMDFIKGTGLARGNTDLRADEIVGIKGLGKKFSGKYYLYSVKHTLSPFSGFLSEFLCARNTVGDTEEGGRRTLEGDMYAKGAPLTARPRKKKEIGKLYPEFINLKWEKADENGNDVEAAEALVGEVVKLTANVKHMNKGETVVLNIYEKDYNNPNDLIERISTTVKSGSKIEAKWKFKYVEDTDDVNSDREQEEKGYTKPEYIFTIETPDGKHKSDKSPVIEFQDWFEYKITDEESKSFDIEIKIQLPDGTAQTFKPDANGIIKIKNLPHGNKDIKIITQKE